MAVYSRFSLNIIVVTVTVVQLLSTLSVLGMKRILCDEQMATDCINSTLNRNYRDVLMIQDGQLDQNIQDLHCSTVFELKRSRMECVDESILGCGHQIKDQVMTYYNEKVDEFEGRCAKEVKQPTNQSDVKTFSHLIAALLLAICMCLR